MRNTMEIPGLVAIDAASAGQVNGGGFWSKVMEWDRWECAVIDGFHQGCRDGAIALGQGFIDGVMGR